VETPIAITSNFLSGGGVRIEVEDEVVTVDLYIIVEPGVNMYDLGQAIQAEVTRAISDMVGVAVRAVNIHIQDWYLF